MALLAPELKPEQQSFDEQVEAVADQMQSYAHAYVDAINDEADRREKPRFDYESCHNAWLYRKLAEMEVRLRAVESSTQRSDLRNTVC